MKNDSAHLTTTLLFLALALPLSGQPEAFTVSPAGEVAAVTVSADTVATFAVRLDELPPGCNSGDAALPISVPDFFANRLDPSFVELKWSDFQAYEGNQWFLERRLEHLPNFVTVRELPEDVMSGRDYVDPNSYSGKTYYRLYGISAEGEKVYTRIAVVGNAAAGGAFSIYPNPVSRQATVTLPLGADAGALILVDALGRVVQRRSVPAGGVGTVSLETGMLAPGAYQLLWRNSGGRTESLRFIKN